MNNDDTKKFNLIDLENKELINNLNNSLIQLNRN